MRFVLVLTCWPAVISGATFCKTVYLSLVSIVEGIHVVGHDPQTDENAWVGPSEFIFNVIPAYTYFFQTVCKWVKMNPTFVLLYFTLSLCINPQRPVCLLVEFKCNRRPTGQLERQESVSQLSCPVSSPASCCLLSTREWLMLACLVAAWQ